MTEVNSFKQYVSPTNTFRVIFRQWCQWEGGEGSADSRSNNNKKNQQAA